MSSKLAKTLADGSAPVYLLHGDETFLTRQAVAWVRHAVLQGLTEDFNLDRFDLRESFDAERMVQAARTLPMMAAKRLVWVRHSELLFSQTAKALSKVIKYVENPDPSTCVIFEATTRVKKNGALYKRVAKFGCVLESTTPYERELPAWVKGRMRSRGRSIRSDAVSLLVEAVGRDLSALDGTLDRLVLFVKGEAEIELEHVEAVVSHSRSRTVWELVDAIADRRLAVALKHSRSLLDHGEAALRLMGMVIRQFRQLLIGRTARAGGASAQEAARAAGVPPYRTQAFTKQLQNYNGAELLRALERLAEADLLLKGSKVPAPIIFECMLVDLCAR